VAPAVESSSIKLSDMDAPTPLLYFIHEMRTLALPFGNSAARRVSA
jgi:hypothetical protein